MNALVVYYTQYGNTRQVAEAIAERLQAAGTARVISVDQLATADLKGVDLLVMGSPTQGFGVPSQVRPILAALPQGMLKGIPFAAFDTSLGFHRSRLMGWATAAKRLTRALRELGGEPLVPPETFWVAKTEGPLAEGELERAKSWAGTVLDEHKRFSERSTKKGG